MSEQKALRKRLKQLFAELQEITASSPADEYPLQGWTWACDARGIYTACSPEVEEVLGIAAEEFIGQPLTSFRLAPESQRYLKAVLERAAPHSEAILQFIHKSGQLLSLRMHILKQQADDGQENGWSGFVQTIQEAATGDSAATLPPSPRLTRLSTDLPSGIAIEEDKLFPVQAPFSLAGELSLQQRRPIAQSGNGQAAASLAVPVQLQKDALALLEIIDDDPSRIWTEDEQRLVEEVANQLALALENARLLRETEARSEELALINRVVAQVASSLDLQENLEFIAAELLSFLPVDHVTIGLLNPSIEALELRVVCSRQANADHLIGKVAPLKNTAMETVIRQQRAVTLTEIPRDEVPEAIRPLLNALKAKKHILFPLMAGDEAIGTLGLHFGAGKRDLNANERRLIDAILTQISASIQNARLFQQVETRSTQLLTAAEVSRAASSILDPNPLIQQTVNLIRERFDLYYVGLFLVDEDGAWTGEPGVWAVLRAGTGEAGRIQVERGHRLKIGGASMIGQCIAAGEARISLQAPGEKQRFPNPYLPDTQSEIALPLISRGKVLGAMTIQSEKPGAFGQEDVRILQTMADQVANALQNASLFDQTQARAEELTILNELSLELSQTLYVEDIIEIMYRYTSRLMDTTYFFVALYDEENDLVSFPLVIENNERSQIPPMQKRRGLTQHVLDTKEPLLIYDNVEQVIAELGLETIIVGEPAQSWLGVPILLGERVFGVIATQNAARPRVFNEHHQELLLAIARQAAIAIQNAQLFEAEQRRRREAETLREATAALVGSLEAEQVLERIVEQLERVLPYDSASVQLLRKDNQGNQFLEIVSVRGWEDPSEVIGLRFPVPADNPNTVVIEQKRPHILSNAPQEHAPFQEEPHSHIRSWLGVPLIVRGELIGMLALDSTKPNYFTEDDVRVATAFADQVATAIQNAQLFSQTQQALAETEALLEITSAATRYLEMEVALSDVLNRVIEITPFSYGLISIFNPQKEQLEMVCSQLPAEMEHALKKQGFGNTLCQRTYMQQSPTTFPDLQQLDMEEFNIKGALQMGLRSYLGVPIISRGIALGTVCLFHTQPLENEQIHRVQAFVETVGRQIGIATENAQLFEQTQRQLANLSTLSEVSQALTRAPLTSQAIAEIICKIFVQTMHIPEASVSLVSDESTMTILADYYLSDDGQEAMLWENVQKEWSLDAFPASRRVVESGEPLIVHVDDPEADPAERNYLQENNAATLIILPMISKGNTIALLEMESETRLEMTEEQLDLATTMANQAAVTLENALLFDRLQRQIENLSLIQQTTADLSAAVSLDGVVNVLLAHLKAATDCDSLSIFLYEDDNQLVRAGMMPMTDENADLIGQTIDLADYPLTRSVLETRQPLAVTADDPRLQEHARQAFAEADIGANLTLPIISGEEVLGTVSINRRKPAAPFDQEEITLLSTLVSQAAVAIQNAHLYDELRETAEELRELDKLKSQFLANMSHELRTPLNSIIGFSRVIMKGIDGPVTDQQMQDLSAIYSAGQHLLSMINDILDISKIEAGKMELAFEELDLAQVINSVMSTARGLVKDKPVELITAIPENLPPLQADPTRVRQILLNLLSNAAKFTEEGSITVLAEESTTPDGRPAILISVKDTGIGIPEEKQPELFEPFTQVDGSLTRKTGGTGLGLSITRLLVELHGGEIGVKSRPGEGSTFYFTLPLTPQRKRTILAVEGDTQLAEMYQRYLADSDYQIIPVLDPRDTLDMAVEYRPFAILLDTALREADSFDILRTLKEAPQTGDIPVIVCSLREEREKALALGAADYLSKPILSEDLRAALDRLSTD